MKYITTRMAADKWGISDRRVRVLCREGRIPDVREENGTYLIPYDAVKPADRRYRRSYYDPLPYGYGQAYVKESAEQYRAAGTILFLKWENETIAYIDSDYNVYFEKPEFNAVVSSYTHGAKQWNRSQFEEFLQGRIVSRDRRDIERILFRCGLSVYDVIRVGTATKAINAKDLLWITGNETEKMQEAVTDVFNSVFLQKVDAEGDSIDTPEGYNIKRYGVYNGHYGIFKDRISPVTKDAESELAVYGLADMMGIPCCPVYRAGDDTVFSQFEYDFSHEYIVHFRRLVENTGMRSDNEYRNLLSVRPQYQADIVRMIVLDFVTRQDDRHLSNIAVKISDKGESFYPLYDNGRSLFYEDSEETAQRACGDIEMFATSFGPAGTYYDYVREISENGICFGRLMRLDINMKEVSRLLEGSGFTGYRYEAAMKWIAKTLEILKNLDKSQLR